MDEDNKTWYISGSLFLKLPLITTKKIIQQEQDSIEKEIVTIDASIKSQTKDLLELEGRQDEFKGFELKPVKFEDLGDDDVRML